MISLGGTFLSLIPTRDNILMNTPLARADTHNPRGMYFKDIKRNIIINSYPQLDSTNKKKGT